jgi:hypothetical protein
MVVSAQKSLEATQSRAEDSERKKPKKKSKKKSSKARQGCGLSLVRPSSRRLRPTAHSRTSLGLKEEEETL